jgi:serine/threonine-protein kinase
MVPLPAPAQSISYGATVCAVVAGDVYCWGDNAWGQLGRGPASEELDFDATPARVQLDGDFVAVQANAGSTCALGIDGSVMCWGVKGLTMSPGDQPQSVPQRISHLEPAVSIALTKDTLCVIGTDGKVRCHIPDGNPAHPPRAAEQYFPIDSEEP